MISNELIDQISQWHTERRHDEIREAILAVPEHEHTPELDCLLARALINSDEFSGALEVLDRIRVEYSNDSYFCVRYAIALFHLHREDEAVEWFKKAYGKGLEELNETPGRYLPKSLKAWVERAELWAPRRREMKEFEAKRRAERKQRLLYESEFEKDTPDDIWDDCKYSLEQYVGGTPTDSEIAEVEEELGYRLPQSYKLLIKRHNGGLLAKNCFENPLQREWTPHVFSIESIYGIDRSKPYSLCGKMGSRFWIKEWGYPDIGVAVCDCPSSGHDMIFLDYSDCGPTGEPCVVHIDQESDYSIHYLADSFKDFIGGLLPEDAFGEEE